MQALDGLRVIELGGSVSASAATKRFSDHGADVIKVEPAHGDHVRRLPPFPQDRPHRDRSAYHLALDTGKKSLALDRGSPSGREVIARLAATAQLLIAELPLEELRRFQAPSGEESPSLVSITPHGEDGPYASRRENDLTIFGWSTRASRHSIVGREPLRYAPNAALMQIGHTAAAVGIAAVWGRRIDGQRREVEVSGVEALLGNVDTPFWRWVVSGQIQPRTAGETDGFYPRGAYRCKDGYILFSGIRPAAWGAFCEAIGHPELSSETRFTSHAERSDHYEEFRSYVDPWLARHTKYEVFARLQEIGLMVAPALDASEVMDDPQSVARRSYTTVEQPGVGGFVIAGAPFRMNGLDSEEWVGRPSPTLGEHTSELLGELGYSPDEQLALHRAGVTG